MTSITPHNPWTIIALILSSLGVGKWVGDAMTRLVNRVRIKRQAERESNADDRAEIENWQKNSARWQGEAVTLQGELAKRDEKIQQLEKQQATMQLQLTEIQAQFAGVLWENRAYRDKYGPLNTLKETP